MRGNSIVKPLLNMLLFIVMLVINALANILPLNNIGTGAVSDSHPNLFAPAAITFSVWAIIYLLLFLFSANYLINYKKFTQEKTELYSRITTMLIMTSVVNSVWIFCWHYDLIIISWLLMIMLLVLLIFINYEILNSVKSNHSERLAKVTFGVYLGWISIATIANTVTLLVYLDWNVFGLSEELLTTLVLVIGAVIALSTIRKFESVSYGLVTMWAYAGILYKHLTVFDGEYNMIIIVSAVLLIALLVAVYMIGSENSRLNSHE